MGLSPQPQPEISGAEPRYDDIAAARSRIAACIHRTPVLTSRSLNAIAGANLFFKCENLQRSGSFKMRGAANAVFSLSKEDAECGVVTHSSGNHGAAVALAARDRGIQAWIVMPCDAPESKKLAVARFGGAVTLCEPTLASREATTRAIQQRSGALLIHPYDDPRVIAGQGTAAAELLEQAPKLDCILAPVSGGGLLSGTGIAVRHLAASAKVIGCEPRQADDAARSLASGKLEPPAQGKTIADGLRATLSPRTFGILRRVCDCIALAEEDEIVTAMRLLWERLKLVIEPSGAVAAVPALFRKIGAEGKNIGVILSGGNVDLNALPFA